MAVRSRRFAPPTDEERWDVASVTMQMRMDVVSNWEAGTPMPVYFGTYDEMSAYCEWNQLLIEEIRGVKPDDGVLIRHTGTRVGYGLVWVKATTKRVEVRKAMVNHIIDAYHLRPNELSPVDADHVVNRASLKKAPDAWVALMPVFYEVNRRTGFIFEKGLEVETSRSKNYPNPLQMFKILSDIWPRTVAEYEEAIKRVEAQHMLPHLTSEIRTWIAAGFPFLSSQNPS